MVGVRLSTLAAARTQLKSFSLWAQPGSDVPTGAWQHSLPGVLESAWIPGLQHAKAWSRPAASEAYLPSWPSSLRPTGALADDWSHGGPMRGCRPASGDVLLAVVHCYGGRPPAAVSGRAVHDPSLVERRAAILTVTPSPHD